MAFHLHEIIIQLNIFPFTWERGHNLPLIHVDWTYLSPFAGNSNTRVKNTGGKNGIPIICGYECSPWCYLYNNSVILAESLYSTLTEHRESWLVYPDTVTTCDRAWPGWRAGEWPDCSSPWSPSSKSLLYTCHLPCMRKMHCSKSLSGSFTTVR